jgi:Holliday junction resolvase RusA-like endonuclease
MWTAAKEKRSSSIDRPMTAFLMTLQGEAPNGKNGWKVARNRLYAPAPWKAIRDSMILQSRAQWRYEPVEHPDVTIKFFYSNAAKDPDNMTTFLLDCLVKAGVFVNDNFKRFNGTKTILPGVKVEKGQERVEIEIYGNFQKRA